jgi:hypothetical protein
MSASDDATFAMMAGVGGASIDLRATAFKEAANKRSEHQGDE